VPIKEQHKLLEIGKAEIIQSPFSNQFIGHATNVEDLRRKCGLTVENLVGKVKAELGNAHAPAMRLETVA
jgi:hypothetical protein